MKIDKFKRYQSQLVFYLMYPRKKYKCACGCKNVPNRRKKWHSQRCLSKTLIKYRVIKGYNKVIRQEVFKMDKGKCKKRKKGYEVWFADHTKAVYLEGWGCALKNF